MNGNTGYSCNNSGVEMIIVPILPLVNFTVDSIHKKSWKKFNSGWKKVLMVMDSAPGNECVNDFMNN